MLARTLLIALAIVGLFVAAPGDMVATQVEAGPLCAGEDPADTVNCNVSYTTRCVQGLLNEGACPL